MTILKTAGLPHLSDTLAAEEVTITLLLMMNEEDLEELGISKRLHRRAILAAANEYKEEKENKTGK